MSFATRLQRKINQLFTKKTWQVSQQYEWKATQEFMQTSDFANHMQDYQIGKFDALSGYRDPLMIKEFFANSTEQYNQFLLKIEGKARLDVGPCLSTPLRQWGGLIIL